MRYTVVLTPDPDGSAVNVTVPAMPNVLTWGRTNDGALASVREAIELHLEGFSERGKPYPADRLPRTRRAKQPRTLGNGRAERQGPRQLVAIVDVSVLEASSRRG